MTQKTNGALEERLNGLETMQRDGFARMEQLITQIDTRLRTIETSAFAEVAVQKARLDAAFQKIDKHTSQLDEQEKFITKLKPVYAVLIWLSVTVGGLIVALLWAVLTHQVVIN